MTTTLQKWGNSQGVRIPKFILDELGIECDDLLAVSAQGDKIIIERAKKRKSIAELFEGYDGSYEPSEIDWGKPVGAEVW